MAKIPEDIIRRIVESANIVEVVSDFVKLRKTGIRYTGLCPFHEDRHDGNFIVYPRGNCYKCFVCGEKGGVVDFLMKHANLSYPDAIRWLGRKYGIETDNIPFDYVVPPPRPLPPPLPTLALPMSLVTEREDTTGDNLVTWLRHGISWGEAQRARIDEVLRDYHVGHARNGMTMFWQIDDEGRVRTGKMMLYRQDGHRDRQARYTFDWVHSALCRRRDDTGPWPFPELYNPDSQECRPTLFGMHLLDRYPQAVVRIVESEKTALIMAIAYGNHPLQVWMACGGMENLSRERLEPIMRRQRRIVLYPDRDGIDKWRAKCANLRYDRAIIYDEPVTSWWQPGDGDKADVADVVVRMINNGSPSVTPTDVIRNNPNIQHLITSLDLEGKEI